MMDIQRFSKITHAIEPDIDGFGEHWDQMDSDPYGEWVRYSDVSEALEKLAAMESVKPAGRVIKWINSNTAICSGEGFAAADIDSEIYFKPLPADKPAVSVPDDYIQKILFHADRCGNADWEADVRDDYCAYLCGPEMSYDECYFENSHEAVLISLVQPKSIKAIIRRLLNCESELKELRSAPSHSQRSAQRINEEDALEIIETLKADYRKEYCGQSIEKWLDACAGLLLEKINNDRCPSHESAAENSDEVK